MGLTAERTFDIQPLGQERSICSCAVRQVRHHALHRCKLWKENARIPKEAMPCVRMGGMYHSLPAHGVEAEPVFAKAHPGLVKV